MLFNLKKQYSHGWSLEIAYTLSLDKANMSYEFDQVKNYEFPDSEYGPGRFDRRHMVSINGIFALPLGFQLGAIFYYSSAPPVNVTLAYDANMDGRNFDWPPVPFTRTPAAALIS